MAEEDERGPGAAHRMVSVMEGLLEKLDALNYEELLDKHNMKKVCRHYFASSSHLSSNPGEQFYMFTIIAAWLINAAGRPFTEPQEHDEPNAIVSNILAELRAFGIKVDFPPSKLKTGSGEHVCLVLDRLADEALKRRNISFKRANYPSENLEEELVLEDDTQDALGTAEEEMIEPELSSKPDEILEATVDAAEWNLEVERVIPHLKATVRTDNKDWRVHLEQMHQYQEKNEALLKESKSYMDKLQEDIRKTQEKVGSREKYINNQLEHLVEEYRSAQAKLSEAKDRYQQASGGVTERSRVLAEISEELEKVKQEMEEKGSRMSDAAPVVKIKQSLTKLKQEIVQIDVRIGVVEHTLLQAKLKEKSNMTRDMHATNIQEPTAGPFA
uniref:Intraflagellar transport protein 57 homolog n=1 Tax=Oryzias melastigma TaxID=30732 RepID=A0A3B3DWC4_ORYME